MNNPYSAPDASLSVPGFEDKTYEPKIFSLNGRIGRLRYIGYSWALIFLCAIVCGILAAALIPTFTRGNGGRPGGAAFAIVMLLVYSPVIAVSVIMAIHRLNDLDNSGWLSLLSLVPFVNFFFGLYLLSAPATNGRNKYGPMPSKNSPLLWVAIFVPLIACCLLIATSMTAYQQNVNKAKAAAHIQQTIQDAQARQEQESSQ